MNFYIYWFFTVYQIYERLSKDKYFDVFATGFFSLFSSSLFYGILVILLHLLNASGFVLNSAKGLGAFIVVVLAINYMFFLPKQRQRRLYQKYKETQSTKKDIITVVLSIISIVLLVSAIRMS